MDYTKKVSLIGLLVVFCCSLFCGPGVVFAGEVFVPGLSLGTATSNSIAGNIQANGNPETVQYYVERSLDHAFNTDVVVIQGWTTAAAFTASGLAPGTTYYFRVKARDAGGSNESLWSAVASKITVPAVPAGVSATTNDPFKVTISWTKTKGAKGYVVFRNNVAIATLGDVSAHEDFSAAGPTITEGTVTASKGTFAGHVSLALTGARVNNGFNHSYQVAAFNESGNSARSGNVSGFRRPGSLQIQWMRSLGDNFLSFASLAGATGTTFFDTSAQIYTVNPPSTITAGHKAGALDTLVVSFSGSSVTAGEGRFYFVQLRADGANPILVSAIRDRGFRHDAIAGTVGFQVYSSANEAGPYAAIGESSANVFEDSGLLPNTRYWYKVRAKSTAGTWSALSEAAGKVTLAAVPKIIPGEAKKTTIAVNIAANGNPSGTQYFVEMSTISDFSAGAAQAKDWSSGTGFLATDLLPGTTYYFRVKARNHDGIETSWSSTVAKSTLRANLPPVVEPLAENVFSFSAGVGEVTLHWNSSDPDQGDILAHTVLIRPPGAIEAISIVPSSGPSGLSHTFAIQNKALWPTGMYHWRVIAQDTGGLATTSAEQAFSIINDLPVLAGPFSDFGSQFKGKDTVFLSWSAAGDLNGDLLRYEVDYYNGNSWATVRALEDANSQLTSVVYSLPENNTNQAKFRVRAHDGFGYSPYLQSRPFIIDSEPPNAPALVLLQEDGTVYSPGTIARKPVRFTLSGAVDNLTGAVRQYSLDAGLTWNSRETGVIAADGEHRLFFRAVDGVGNISIKQQAVIIIYTRQQEETGAVTSPVPLGPALEQKVMVPRPGLFELRIEENRAEAIIDAFQYKNMAEIDRNGVITVSAGQVSFFFPHNEIDILALTGQLGANSAREVKIHIMWQKPEEERARRINEMLEALGGKPFGFSKDVTAFAAADNGRKEEIRGFRTYVNRLIKIDTVNEVQGLIAVWVNLETNEVIPVPTSVKIVDGMPEITISHQGTGTYALIRTPSRVFLDIGRHWAREEIESLAARMIINGKSDNIFDPDNRITRAEFTAMLVRSLGLVAWQESGRFSDIGGQWFNGLILAAAGVGLVQGFDDGSFRPNSYITREQIAVIMARALEYAGLGSSAGRMAAGQLRFQDAEDISPWAIDKMATITWTQILRGDAMGKLLPTKNATRAEAAVMIKRMLNVSGLWNN